MNDLPKDQKREGPPYGDGNERPKQEGGFLPDALRRAVISGIQAVFTTEESVRAIVGALVPKELMTAVGKQLDGAKDDALRLIGREVREFLEHINIGEELRKILTSVSFEIKTEVRFIPNEEGRLKPEIKSRVRPKRPLRAAKAATPPRPKPRKPPR